MSANIIGKNHLVTNYLFNSRRRHIVETIRKDNDIDRMVVEAKREKNLGNKWEDVYNYFDKICSGGMTPAIENAIERLTY